MPWIRFSKFTRISSAEQYFSRVWYQVSAKYGKELNELYPASSELSKTKPEEKGWLVDDAGALKADHQIEDDAEAEVEELLIEEGPPAEEIWDEDAAIEALAEAEVEEIIEVNEELAEAEAEIAEDFDAVSVEILEDPLEELLVEEEADESEDEEASEDEEISEESEI